MSIFVAMKRNQLKDYIESMLVRSSGRILSFLPNGLQYLISHNLIRPLLQNVVKYRRETIIHQLQNAMQPAKGELKAYTDSYYRHLSRLIMEVVTGYYTSQKDLMKKMVYVNPEVLDEAYANGRDVFMISGHYANWEWGIAVAQQYLRHQVIGVYKPLHNKYINQFVLNKREKNGSKLIPTTQLLRDILTPSSIPRVYMLLGDQYPKDQEYQEIPFLNQPTLFQTGIERIAGKYQVPIAYADILWVNDGKYSLELSWLDVTKADTITKQYANALEKSILKKPDLWLWSHRRWRN